MAATAPSGHEVIEVAPLEILPEDRLARVGGSKLTLSIRALRQLRAGPAGGPVHVAFTGR